MELEVLSHTVKLLFGIPPPKMAWFIDASMAMRKVTVFQKILCIAAGIPQIVTSIIFLRFMVQVCTWSSNSTRQDWMIAIETDRIFSMSSNLKHNRHKNIMRAVTTRILSLGVVEKTVLSTYLNLAIVSRCFFSRFWGECENTQTKNANFIRNENSSF